MSKFYKLQEKMKSLLSGDMALESLETAENEYLNMDEQEEYTLENDYPDPCCEPEPSMRWNPKLITINRKKHYIIFNDEISGHHDVWQKGDLYKDDDGKYKPIPDCWHLDDLRHDDITYRPVGNM